MEVDARIGQYKVLVSTLISKGALDASNNYKKVLTLATLLEAYAVTTTCKTGHLGGTIPIWEYASGIVLFASDKPEAHYREFLGSYMERMDYIKQILNIESIRNKVFENPETIENLTEEDLHKLSAFGPWQDSYLENMRRSKQILEERQETTDAFIVCKKCKSNAIDTEQKQTRSADEPMTVFCLCRKCGTRFTMK